jgi:hypothetical protein
MALQLRQAAWEIEMTRPSAPIAVLAALVAAAPFLGIGRTAALPAPWPEHLTGVAVNTGTFETPRARTVDILVFSWSTDADTARTQEIYAVAGAPALQYRLRGEPRLGFIRTPDDVSYDIRFARQFANAGSRRIVIATDRQLRLWQRAMRSFWLEYPFTFIELRLDHRGEGEGKMSISADIAEDAETGLALADYDHLPVRLMFVRAVDVLTP